MAAQQFYRVKLWARAKASLEKAIENVPSHARHSNLSGAMLNMDEIQLALANANTAIAMTEMGYAPGYERKGRALFALSQTAEEPLRSESAFEAYRGLCGRVAGEAAIRKTTCGHGSDGE